MVKAFATLLVVFLVTGCQSAGLYLANVANDTDSYYAKRGVAYGKEPWQKLDVYWPKDYGESTPIIVFYYGGSWTKGSKDEYEFVASRFVEDGFIVIIPDYGKYPDAVYPNFVEDAAEVTKWLDINVEAISGGRENIHLIGHSAGAHIGAMLIADERFLAAQSLAPNFYRSFIGISGPYSFTPGIKRYQDIFGPEEKYPLMQADRFIDGDEPPMLLLHAERDWLVNKSNMEKMVAAIDKAGGIVSTSSYESLGHLSIIGSFSNAFPIGDDVANDIVTFINEQAGGFN
ncbi:MAG: alpha/beta hydrolase [Sphaerospermopsis sp. SIO1G2]|nr:alpha/beta hydrolase [Sphaerospermopsis sp. SIO1G2]